MQDATEFVVAGTGDIYVAPVGSTLPTDWDTTLDAAFGDSLGYTSEDGVGFTSGSDITDFRSWQSRQATRRERNTQDVSVAFDLQQWNEDTVPLAFGGGAIEATPHGYVFRFPSAGDALDEKAMVVDVQDGERTIRIVIPRGNVLETVETRFQRTELATLPITFGALEPTDGSDICAVYFSDHSFSAAS